MFRKRTVFVVGAGCSREFGLPVGPVLLDLMFQTMSDPSTERFDQIYDAFARSGVPFSNVDIEPRIRRFRAGLSTAPSIDQYLDFHRDDPALVMLGKCVLASEILYAEAGSNLNEENSVGPLPDAWLRRLLYLMMDSTSRRQPEQLFANLSFICFNYDRVIEVFFRRAIQALVHCTGPEADELVRQHLRVWHTYGTVGSSFPGAPGISNGVPSFTQERIHSEDILAAAKCLRTFTEGATDDEERRAIRTELMGAEQIVFLGFSFLEANMRLLSVGTQSGTAASPIYGTVLSMPDPTVEIARSSILQSLGPRNDPGRIDHRVKLHPLSASDFIWQFGQTLRS